MDNVENQVGITLRNLYKIFGSAPERHLDAVRNGMDKATLRDAHGHVLGLRNINLDIRPGEIQVVMGLSGSGKSTLIRHINRLIEPTAGEILVGGKNIVDMGARELRRFRSRSTAMVFQKFALFPHYTVLENAEYGLRVQGVSGKKRHQTARHWIERVGLAGYEQSYPNQLSGGMQQRVGLARALANDAPILLMDEAFSALDPMIRTDMQTVLLDLQQELSKTVVFITHDLDEALRLGDRIAILRDGEIIQQGTGQEIVLKPADEYISSFVRNVNRGRVIRCRALVSPETIGVTVDGPALDVNMVLEDAARLLSAENKEHGNIVSRRGRHLGTVSLGAIVAAMVPPQEGEAASAPAAPRSEAAAGGIGEIRRPDLAA